MSVCHISNYSLLLWRWFLHYSTKILSLLVTYLIKVLASILSLSLLSTLASASSSPAHVGGDIGDDLLCTVCIDIVTDIDSWLTSDTTEDQIVEWMFGLCEVSNSINIVILLKMNVVMTISPHHRNWVTSWAPTWCRCARSSWALSSPTSSTTSSTTTSNQERSARLSAHAQPRYKVKSVCVKSVYFWLNEHSWRCLSINSISLVEFINSRAKPRKELTLG